MKVDLFDFELPEALIALRPAEPRSAGRLLEVAADGAFFDRTVADLPEALRPGDLLVFNDTKVIPAHLMAERVRGSAVAKVELNLHRRVGSGVWRAFAKGAKKIREGDMVQVRAPAGVALCGEVTGCFAAGEIELDFGLSDAAFDAALAEVGDIPLPPYIAAKRAIDAQDSEDYQTIYARHKGAVAAPTAGLHFDDQLMQQLRNRGIERCFVTLHVGAGTFLPVKSDDTQDHVMHQEWGRVTVEQADQINRAKAAGRRIVAIGTTSLRILESASTESGEMQAFEGATDIFIEPGYKFKCIDGLVTNFHLPRSTLFMLVSALAGRERMQRAYAHAIASAYRFYSYGDASLLWRAA